MSSYIGWFIYGLIVIYLVNSPILVIGDICWHWKNILFEILHLIFFLILPILYWLKAIDIIQVLYIFLAGLIILDILETILIALTGSYYLFQNKGSSLRERKVAFLLNFCFLGKLVKAVRFAHSGGSIYVSVDFFDDQTADGRYISDKLPSFFQALEINSNIRALMRL